MRKFSFDPALCIGCLACETACKRWHGRGATENGYRQVSAVEVGEFPDVRTEFSSRALAGCDLCATCGGDPRCAITCPTGALAFK